MKVTLEISNESELEKLYKYFKSTNINFIEVVKENTTSKPIVEKGNKNINPKALFGIWKDNPLDIIEIRENAWKRSN